MADDDLVVSGRLRIARSELRFRFDASGGPGGQHANKTASRVEASFDVTASASLTDAQRARLLDRLGPVVRVVAADSRSQAKNREIAETRLAERLAGAFVDRRPRRPTKRTRGANERRLAGKSRRSQIKTDRQRPRFDG